MSNNLLGKSELLNACMPELTTGPEALADMLGVNKSITHLDLSWNSIRGDSAVAFAGALPDTAALKTLNLSNNSFSCAGSQEIGRSLFKNKSITELDLSYNQVSIKGAMVIASALKKNPSLSRIILDGNVVGRLGSECLVSALRENASPDAHTTLSLVECDCTKEDRSVFDPQYPTKPVMDEPKDPKRNPPYVLDLAKPYGYVRAKRARRRAPKDYTICVPHQPSASLGGSGGLPPTARDSVRVCRCWRSGLRWGLSGGPSPPPAAGSVAHALGCTRARSHTGAPN
jgi:hypothetical protein